MQPSRERERPYHRPPLSKDFLCAETKRNDVFVHSADWAQQHGVEGRLGTDVQYPNVAGQTVRLGDGMVLGFEPLLVATGASPRPLLVPGADLNGVLLLRMLQDSERIRRAATGKRRALIIGGGFIGAEVVASLRQMGLKTVLVGRESVLWEHIFGNRLAPVFQRTPAAHGVEIIDGDQATGPEGQGHVERVLAKGGRFARSWTPTTACSAAPSRCGSSPSTRIVPASGSRNPTESVSPFSALAGQSSADWCRWTAQAAGRHSPPPCRTNRRYPTSLARSCSRCRRSPPPGQ